MKTITWTQHALAKLLKMEFSRLQVEATIASVPWLREGKTKFKAVSRIKNGLLIAVCADYPDRICVITVLQKRG